MVQPCYVVNGTLKNTRNFRFRLTRLYWSTVDPNKRCIYTCHIEEIDKPEVKNKLPAQNNKPAENHTVTCHENDTDIFKSAGLGGNVDRSKQSDKPVISPGDGNAQNNSNLKENSSEGVSCPLVTNVGAKKQVQRTVILPSQRTPNTPQDNLPSTKKPLSVLNLENPNFSRTGTANTPLITVSKNNKFSSQSVPNTTVSCSTPQHNPGAPHVTSNTHPQAGMRAAAPNLLRKSLPGTPFTTKSNITKTTPARNVPPLHPTLSGSRAFPRASNVRNISPMDLLIDLTKPKPNSVKTTLGNQIQSFKFLMTSKQSIVGPSQVKASTIISLKRPRTSYSSATMSSRANAVRNIRSTPIPLAPKPVPYVPIEHNSGANYKRLAPKPSPVLEQKTSHPPQTSTMKTTTTPLIFHSTEFVSQGGSSNSVKVKTRPFPSTQFSGSSQLTNRPTNIALGYPQGIPPASSTHPVVPVTTKVVQLSKTPTQLKFKEIPSKVVKLNASPNLAVSKPNQTASKIVQLNTDPAQLAANFLRLRAKTAQGGLKTTSLTSSTSPVFSTSKHVPVSSFASTSPQTSTTPKVSQTSLSNVTPTKTASQTLNSVAAVKGCNDSDGMAVVVGSPEQITKLLSENPNMIQLLGSKSTDYLGQLLTSHSKNESCVRRLDQTLQQNKFESIKQARKRPAPLIDLTKSPSKHVTDLTKVANTSSISSAARNLQSTPISLATTSKPSSLPSTITQTSLPSTLNQSSLPSTSTQSVQPSTLVPSSVTSTLSQSNRPSTLTQSNLVSTPTSSIKMSKIDLTKGRNAVRKLDRTCLNTTVGPKRPIQGAETVSLGKPTQSGIKSPTLNVHPTAHSPTNATSNPQYIFQNRRFLHASLDTPSLEKKANRVSPLSSPTKIMAHIEDQSKILQPVLSASQQDMEYFEKSDATKQQEKEGKILNDGKTASIAKKDIVKSRGKRTYTKRKYTKRKELDKNISCKTKKKDTQVSGKRKGDENDLRTAKRTKIDEDDIVLPDFARIKQSDLRSKRLEKVNQELNVTFIITSEEGLEVKARTCEGTCGFLIWVEGRD